MSLERASDPPSSVFLCCMGWDVYQLGFLDPINIATSRSKLGFDRWIYNNYICSLYYKPSWPQHIMELRETASILSGLASTARLSRRGIVTSSCTPIDVSTQLRMNPFFTGVFRLRVDKGKLLFIPSSPLCVNMPPLMSSVTISLLNLTSQSIFAFVDESLTESLVHLTPAMPVTFGQAFPRFSKLVLTLTTRTEKDILTSSTAKTSDSWTVRLGRTISRRRQWEKVHVPGAPWCLYRFKMNKGHHRVLVMLTRDLTSWMKPLPSTVPLSALCLPGVSRYFGAPPTP
jgi:hypothetical protein